MLRKHFVLIGITVAVIFMITATRYYPGGSQLDKHSIGYSWKNNYISNLFSDKAVNDEDNSARPWAVAGMFFLCVSFAIFFIRFSQRIPVKSAAAVIKYVGAGAMFFALLIATPLHDLMVTISGTMALISIFYITVFIFKSKLHFFKFLSIACLLVFYTCNFMYYSSTNLKWLPVMQKLLFSLIIIWIVDLDYFSKAEDFEHLKKAKPAK